MKKLMIAAAIVCAAAFAQAAQWTWGIASTSPMMKPGTEGTQTDVLTSGTAYLFADLTTLQLQTMVADFADSKLSLSGYEQGPASISSSGRITAVNFDDSRSSGQTVNWTMVITSTIDGKDYLFIDTLAKDRGADGKNVKVTFEELANSKAAALDAKTDGYTAGGHWYAAVPEPTSGLLLLLGVAGLALRRRRA